MRPGSFKPSHGPGLFTTRAFLSGSADNISINSATVIAPSPKVTPERPSLPPIRQRFRPLEPCKAANEAEQDAINHDTQRRSNIFGATLCAAAVELPRYMMESAAH